MIVRPLTDPLRAGLLCCSAVALLFMPSENPAKVPSSRMGEPWWRERHERCVETAAEGSARIVFLGDSLTARWEMEGKAIWDREFAPLDAVNFGFPGDGTNHVLWRIRNGELRGIEPQIVVLLIGTNNVSRGASPEDTAEGVAAILSDLQTTLPDTKILLLGAFPRGLSVEDPLWQRVAHTDELLEKYDGVGQVRFLDIGDAFIKDDGSLSTELFPDALHLSEMGYEAWAQAMRPTLQEMLDQ